MDWIEQWFGFSRPDGGDVAGAGIMLVAAAVLVVAVIWRVPAARSAVLRFFAQLHARTIGRQDG